MAITFPDILRNLTDDNGTIPWSIACQTAKEHGVFEDFYPVYEWPFRVHTGEFLIWLGY